MEEARLQLAGPILRVVAGVVRRADGWFLVCRRAADAQHARKWEFPGGKVEEGEDPERALVRELREELGLEVVPGRLLDRVVHRYDHGPACDVSFFEVREYTGVPENRIFAEIRWVRAEELEGLEFLEADRDFVRRLARGG
ncbi:MAG: NUDIX hydrolase [Candidatus Binatia bacterium]|nr:MAG: NUDIX hydrolase [Candidatus Binatia bacterium]